jgi:hypothetical protein
MVVFSKIVPVKIEATCFALFTSSSNLGSLLSGLIGTAVNNLYVGVTRENLDNYFVLNIISYATCILPLFFLYYVPTQTTIKGLQRE